MHSSKAGIGYLYNNPTDLGINNNSGRLQQSTIDLQCDIGGEGEILSTKCKGDVRPTARRLSSRYEGDVFEETSGMIDHAQSFREIGSNFTRES